MNVELNKNIKSDNILFQNESSDINNSAQYIFSLLFLAKHYANKILLSNLDLTDDLLDKNINEFVNKLRQEIKHQILLKY